MLRGGWGFKQLFAGGQHQLGSMQAPGCTGADGRGTESPKWGSLGVGGLPGAGAGAAAFLTRRRRRRGGVGCRSHPEDKSSFFHR